MRMAAVDHPIISTLIPAIANYGPKLIDYVFGTSLSKPATAAAATERIEERKMLPNPQVFPEYTI